MCWLFFQFDNEVMGRYVARKILKVRMKTKLQSEISLSSFNRASTPLNFPLGLFSFTPQSKVTSNFLLDNALYISLQRLVSKLKKEYLASFGTKRSGVRISPPRLDKIKEESSIF